MSSWNITCVLWNNEVENCQIKYLVDDIAREAARLIPGPPPTGFKPIMLVHDPYFDHRLYYPLDPEVYKIGIATGKDGFGQAACEFGHELMRIYCDPRISNWFTMALSHMASFYFLDFLAGKWENDPPIKQLAGFCDCFTEKKNEVLREIYQNIDMYQNQVTSEWIKEDIKKLAAQGSRGNRYFYDLIALEIYPVFREYPDAWKIIPYVPRASRPGPPRDPDNLAVVPGSLPDFTELRRLLPAGLKSLGDSMLSKVRD